MAYINLPWASGAGAEPMPLVVRPVCAREPVTFYLGEWAAAERTARRLFGRKLAPRDYAALAGAPEDAAVEVGVWRGGLYVEMYQPSTYTYHAVRLVRGAGAERIVVNDGLYVSRAHAETRGLTLAVLHRQVRAAAALKINRIELVAARSDRDDDYYTWPRMGFDGPLSLRTVRRLPPPLAGARRVLDLMETERGRAWWKTHGATLKTAFDLAAGSRSREVLQRYCASRRFHG